MITGLALQTIYVFLNWIVQRLPAYPFPSQITNAIEYFWSLINLISLLLPVTTIQYLFGVYVGYEFVYLVWVAVHYVLKRIRN